MTAAPTSDKADAIPETIGRYRIVRSIGQGAMGRVFLAHDPILQRDVAVKLLRSDLGLDRGQLESLQDRMRHEARASARVSHPNIVALHDMGDAQGLGLFLVFEYAEGVTLKERLESGRLEPDRVATLARELGSALSTAHASGVLHRDIKPDNVILGHLGAKIADFGIARVPDSTLTKEGGVLGTPAYSAPESIADGTFSPLSDQFSMAATLWEALAGRRAFPGDDAIAVASKIQTEEPPKIAQVVGVDPRVDTVLARGLSKVPGSRFPSCEEFGEALGVLLDGRHRATMPTLPDQYHLEQREASRGGASGAAAFAFLAGAGVVAAAWYAVGAPSWQPPPASPTSTTSSTTSAAPSASDAPVGFLAEAPPKRVWVPKTPTSPTPSGGTDGAPSASASAAAAAPSSTAGAESDDDDEAP